MTTKLNNMEVLDSDDVILFSRHHHNIEEDGGNKETKVTTLGHLGMGTGQVAPFDQVFDEGILTTPNEIKEGQELSALVIWGGEDISPSIYGHQVSTMTGAGPTMSRRDFAECTAARECIKRGIPLIGVCRGAQLVCAMAGGSLIQHVDKHAGGGHPIETSDGRIVVSSSVHHQMMWPYDVEHELLAWATPRRATMYIVGDDSDFQEARNHPEAEIVWFPKIKALAIQGHPEFHGNPKTDPFVQLCMEYVRQYIVS
jgi:GMP synthase-like glutamine amidotransferase